MSSIQLDQAVFSTLWRPFFAWLLVILVVMGLDWGMRDNWVKSNLTKALVIAEMPAQMIMAKVKAPFEWMEYSRNGMTRIAELEERLAKKLVDEQKILGVGTVIKEEGEGMHEVEVKSGLPEAELMTKLISTKDGIYLNAGGEQGLEEGRMVTDMSGVLLGKVQKVGRYTSKLERVGEGMGLAVRTNREGTEGLLVREGERVEMREVLQTEALEKGDVVVTSGGEAYPQGVVIGVIAETYSEASQVTKSGLVDVLGNDKDWVMVY